MTDLEINKQLALAIGWGDSEILVDAAENRLIVLSAGMPRLFDYRDPRVIWPIAERFNAFPQKDLYNGWYAWVPESPETVPADTAAKAVALAVIGGK